MRRMLALAAFLHVSLAPCGALAQSAPFVDPAGVEWRQLVDTDGFTWNQVAQVCPTDGVTPCSGMLGGVDVTGWVWATHEQVSALFDMFVPGIEDSLGGPEYTLPALGFCSGAFAPTYAAYGSSYTYLYVGGLTAATREGAAVGASVSVRYPAFNSSWSLVDVIGLDEASSSTGVWLRSPPAPTAPCPGDVNGDGVVNFADLNIVLGNFGMSGGQGDTDGDGIVDFADLNTVLGAFGAVCE